MPKSKYYFDSLKKYKHYKHWQLIKHFIKNNYNKVIDIESIFNENNNMGIFHDDVHLSNDGAVETTKIIKKRLSIE